MLLARWEEDRRRFDLDRAFEVAREAVDLAPRGDADRPQRLDRLANTTRVQWQEFGRQVDLDRGFAAVEESAELTRGGWYRPDRLVQLAWFLRERWGVRSEGGDVADLDRAVELMVEAVGLTSPAAQLWVGRLDRLAIYVRGRWLAGGGGEDGLSAALMVLSGAVGSAGGASVVAGLVGGRAVCGLGLEGARWEDTAGASSAVLAQAREAVGVLGPTGAGESCLGLTQGLTAAGIYALCRMGRAREAVELAESGLGVLVAEMAELDEQALAAAEAARPGLVTIYRARREVVRQRAAEGRPYTSALMELSGARRRLEEQAGPLVPAVGFGEIAELAARAGRPVLYVAATPVGGVAVRVGPDGGCDHEWLDGLTADRVGELVSGLREAVDTDGGVGSATNAAVSDVLAGLAGVLPKVGAEGALVVPVGPLGLLPLSAAWQVRSSDSPPVSVAVSGRLHVLAAGAAGNRPGTGRLLAVTDPSPCHDGAGRPQSPLPEAAAVGRRLASQPLPGVHLEGPEATREAVLGGLPDAWLVYLGVHGVLDWQRPSQSRALLADGLDGTAGSLSVGDVVNSRVAGESFSARLVVFASCWLGAAGTVLPDEGQGFPTALIQGGAAGVIAPLWPVSDGVARHLLTRFFYRWLDAGDEPAKALAVAISDTRGRYPHDPSWAAFTLTGI